MSTLRTGVHEAPRYWSTAGIFPPLVSAAGSGCAATVQHLLDAMPDRCVKAQRLGIWLRPVVAAAASAGDVGTFTALAQAADRIGYSMLSSAEPALEAALPRSDMRFVGAARRLSGASLENHYHPWAFQAENGALLLALLPSLRWNFPVRMRDLLHAAAQDRTGEVVAAILARLPVPLRRLFRPGMERHYIQAIGAAAESPHAGSAALDALLTHAALPSPPGEEAADILSRQARVAAEHLQEAHEAAWPAAPVLPPMRGLYRLLAHKVVLLSWRLPAAARPFVWPALGDAAWTRRRAAVLARAQRHDE